MEFSYKGYLNLIDEILSSGFEITDYKSYNEVEKPCILRHDVDFSLDKALEFAEFEKEHSIHSTYYILLTSNMYNAMSHESKDIICEIHGMGHDIGLHFDETRYSIRWADGFMGGWSESFTKKNCWNR